MDSKSGAILLFLLIVSKHDGSARRLHTRNLANFGNMVNQVTNRNPLDFNNYGNHCGKGGGGTTIDEIDVCCKNHDECYSKTKENGTCPMHLGLDVFIYITGYSFEVIDGKITCKGGDFLSQAYGEEDCAIACCECDKTATECFFENLASYNNTHKKGIIEKLL